jgi:hypothetical protein
VAGSRREYLAADKPKIYITVKLSSVTHACRGSDPDDRPKFNVAIIYEDNAAGKRAKHFYDRVIRELADECDFSLGKEKPVRNGSIYGDSISKKRFVSCADSLMTPITTFAVPLGNLDPAGVWACSKDGSPLCHAHPIPCSRRDNSVPQERLRRRASAKLC